MAAEMKDITPTKERVRVPNATDETSRRNLAVVPEPKSLLAVIAQAAADPRCDVQKMQALLDMSRQIEERDSQKAFTAAFIKLQNEIPAIRRDGKIEIRAKDSSGERSGKVQQATPYATFNAIMKAVAAPLKRHGFSLSFSTEPSTDGARIIVRGILEHEMGHSRTTSFPLPAEASGSKNNVQGWGSSMSYGRRYCTIALLNIVSEAPEDIDTDGHQGNFKPAKGGGLAEVPDHVPTITAAQKETLLEKINWCGVSLAKFHEHYGIEKTADLPANLFDAAVKACEDFHANKQAKERHG
jgi:hypothetical protein